ncbi:MAG TPA: hypothetical protein PK587_12670 [Syntrophales bacterium]|mgnify:CR=1 FL=1|nr:hypothetical protein [Syntrophales bacterium]
MANLQIKGIDDELYIQIKELAAAENRSISQQILFLAKEYLAKRKKIQTAKSPARALLDLSGSWEDSRTPEEIIREIKKARRSTRRLKDGL